MRPLADIIYAACAHPATMIPAHPTPAGRRRIGAEVKAAMQRARRFYISDEVIAAACELGVQHPDIVLAMLARARLPFAHCWVEWDNRVCIEAGGGVFNEQSSPERAGALVERLDEAEPLFRMTTMGNGIIEKGAFDTSRGHVMPSPMSVIYRTDKPMADRPSRHNVAALAGLSPVLLQNSLVGSSYSQDREKDDAEAAAHRRDLCAQLTRHATPVLTDYFRRIIEQKEVPEATAMKVLQAGMIEEAGTWRLMVTLFALINAQDYVASDQVFRQGHNRMVGGKVVPYLEHRLVSLKLPRKVAIARVLRAMADAIPRRRHEVSGHWRQSRRKGLPNCEHAYVDETPRRQVCVIPGCGHRCWWVNNFTRGDARIGMVVKEWAVTL